MQIDRRWRKTSRSTRYMFELSNLLAEHGNEIVPFAVQDSGNEPSQYSSIFVSPLDLLNPFRMPVRKIAASVLRMMYSREASSRIALLADITRPDIAHIHNIFIHISPSILPPLIERGIGTIMTVQDSKLICPSQLSYRNGSACYNCRPYHYNPCIRGKCKGGSHLASSLCALEMLIHDIIHAYSDKVDYFIAPSWFMADKLVGRGIPHEKVVMIPDFVDTSRWSVDNGSDRNYIFYWSRIEPQYGINTLVRAVADLPEVELKIASTGLQDQEQRELAWELGARNIEFLGYRNDREIQELVSGSRFVCLPFESPGSAPIEILEAFAAGRPVVTTNIAGMPEVVHEGVTGRLVIPGNVESLRDAIESLWSDPAAEEMGMEARRQVEEEYSPSRHYERISEVYQRVRRT